MSSTMRILLSALVALGGTVASSQATTVGFGAGFSSRTVFEQNLATQIAVGSLVWVGTFANESFSMGSGSIASNVATIQSGGGWSQFTGTSTLGITTNPGSSKVGGSVTDNSVTANAFNGDNLYVWIFNAPSVGASTQMGIFRSTTPTPWVFPTNLGGAGDAVSFSTTNAGALIAAIGGIGSVTSSTLALSPVAPVPEPSTFAVGTMLALTSMAVRRRRPA